MGTKEQVRQAGGALRDSLQTVIRDGAFDPADREDFSRIHLALIRRLQRFSSSPKYGDSSPQYDAFIQNAGNATSAVRNCNPSSPSSIQNAQTQSAAASNALPSITGGGAFLQGALRVNAPPTAAAAVAGEPEASFAPPGGGGDGGDGGDGAPEPYYQSLVKLFPVEAVTLYPMAVGVAGDDRSALYVLIGVIALVVVGLRYFGTKPAEGGPPEWAAIGVSLVSFLLYAAALGGFGVIYGTEGQTAMLLSFITVIWVAFVPRILRVQPSASGGA
jgi:hypothetical protein